MVSQIISSAARIIRSRQWPRLLAAMALSMLAFSPVAASEGPFWKVTGDRGSAFLLGSLHFGTRSMYPLSDPVNAAFEQSDRLVVEVNLDALDPAEIARWMAEEGVFRDGTTLSEHVSAGTWAALERRAVQYEIPLELLTLQRPWLAAFTLTALALAQKGFSDEFGVDRHFINRAAQRRLPIVELESFETQIGFLSDLSSEQQEHFLEATLKDLDTEAGSFEKIIAAWRGGDAEALDLEINAAWRTNADGEVLYQRLIEERNARMAAAIAQLLESGGSTFVVVGAAHLVGAGGIAARLQSRGYRVEMR